MKDLFEAEENMSQEKHFFNTQVHIIYSSTLPRCHPKVTEYDLRKHNTKRDWEPWQWLRKQAVLRSCSGTTVLIGTATFRTKTTQTASL